MYSKTIILAKPDIYLHLYNRGVNKQNVFFSRENYLYFLRKMKKYKAECKVLIMCYCLMPNHFHFLVKQLIPHSVSKFMSGIFNSYPKAVNKQLGRSGHLFEGKYKFKIVDKEEYLIHLARYIDLNPVFANLVTRPEDWEYSSYRDAIGLRNGTLPDLSLLRQYFPDVNSYVDFVNDYKVEDRRKIESYIF